MSLTALYTAATGVQALEKKVDVLANNIANMGTTAFYRMRPVSQDLSYENHNVGMPSGEDSINPTGLQVGHGVSTVATVRVMEQGGIQTTERPLDMMIGGQGFFQVELPSGEVGYTRAGNFVRGPDGQLETIEGYKFMPGIVVPENAIDISVTAAGKVSARIAGDPNAQELGLIELARFINPSGLESKGQNIFMKTAASGDAVVGTADNNGFGKIMQGALEKSNVKPVIEITSLVQAQRGYELNTRAMKTADEMEREKNRILGS